MIFEPTSDLAKKIAARAEDRNGSIKNVSEGRSDVYRINPYKIQVEDGFNVRSFDSPDLVDHIDTLARSIAENGVLHPLTLRRKGEVFVVKDGECRLRATIRAIEVYGAEINTVPVCVTARHESDADAVLGIIVENSGLPLDALAKSNVVKRLKAFGWSDTDIANRTAYSKSYVVKLLEMAGLDEEIKDMIRAGTVSATFALETARSNGFDGEKTLAALSEAQTVAEEKGKARITRATTSGKLGAVPVRTRIANIFETVDVDLIDDSEDATVCLTLSAQDWATVKELLKLK